MADRDDEFSQEDEAWVDSCLVKDEKLSEDDSWSGLADALLIALSINAQPTFQESAAAAAAANLQADEPLTLTDDSDSAQFMEEQDHEPVVLEETSPPIRNNEAFFSASTSDLGGEEGDTDESSAENIFRIWDLDTPDEENELMEQLRKAMMQSSLSLDDDLNNDPSSSIAPPPPPPPPPQDHDLNGLITGFTDLSLWP